MANNTRNSVDKAFQMTHRDNPLRQLNPSERKYLWALLLFANAAMSPQKGDAIFKKLDRMSKIVSDATNLSTELKSQVFSGSSSEALGSFTAGFEDLPMRLIEFSKPLKQVLDSVGKPGHKKEALVTEYIVQASEFVLVRIGQYNDQHLSELFQAIGTRAEDSSIDLSSEAIHKRRERFREQYPLRYASTLRRVRRYFEKSICSTPS
jgi:hypothetical protein